MKKSPDAIIQTVCQVLELDLDKFVSDGEHCQGRRGKRVLNYCDGRFIAAYLIRKHFGKEFTYAEIALKIGKVKKSGLGDHSLAMHYENICRDYIKGNIADDGKFMTRFNQVESAIEKYNWSKPTDGRYRTERQTN